MSEQPPPVEQPPLPAAPLQPGVGAPPPAQLAYAQPYPPAFRPPEHPRARQLVRISEFMCWGGLLLLFLGTPAVGIGLRSGLLATALAVVAVISLIVGAVIGQIGRGMQGRVV